jgi:PST family polysaccharide transporter
MSDREDDPATIDVNRGTVARSARWSLVSLLAKQAARIGFSILLARLLGPENFGIIAQATIYLALASVFLDVGVASALIQRERLDREVIGTATWANLAVLSFLVVLTLAGAGLWADFFNTPELTAVLRVLSLTFVFNGFAVVPTALLTRRLDFKLLGVGEVVSTLIGGVVGVALALNGGNYWALVAQTLVRDAVFVAIVLWFTGPPVFAWSRAALSSIARFSRNVFGSQILNFVNQNADNTLIAWRLGATQLAYYALSYRVLMLPVQILGQTANRLVLPVFSRLNDDRPRQTRYYLTVITSLSLTVTPIMMLVALGASRGVPLVFGPDWDPAIVPMQILAVASIARVLSTPNSAVMLARGKAHWVFRLSLITTSLLVLAFAVGLHWGITGVAWAFLLAGLPLALVILLVTARLIPLTVVTYVKAISPAATGAIVMVAAWAGAARVLGPGTGDLAFLLVCTAAAGGAFMALLLLAWRDVARQQAEFLRLMWTRTRSAAA